MPQFELAAVDGSTVRSQDLLGRGPIVLYFYPKDDTPGCTVEACAFRDEYQDFLAAGAVVVGISPDTVESHREFARRRGLPFLLLSDPERRVFRRFGVTDFLGMFPGRETFVMDATGVVRHHVRSALRPRKHVREALAAVRAAAGSA
jgi:peroxiredoxin Q/BCP